jgi:hypothetical protein
MRAYGSNTTITPEKHAISTRVMATLGIITHHSIFFHIKEFVASVIPPFLIAVESRELSC